MSARDSYVETFGEAEARALEAAAQEHKNGIHDNPGSDPFRWAVVIAIGYQCAEVDSYRDSHGIHAPWEEIKQWIIDHGDLAAHDGDVDYLSLMAGKYTEYVEGQA